MPFHEDFLKSYVEKTDGAIGYVNADTNPQGVTVQP